jgi:DNA invertase Pin-like site-specific DNA recombinase
LTTGVFLEPQDLDKIIESLEKRLDASVERIAAKKIEGPMTAKETAKFLKCHVNTVYSNWTHLRHIVNDRPYWLASEINEYIKNQ